MKVLMKINIIYIITMLVLLPGCGRWVDWGNRTFEQTPTVNSPVAVAQKYIRSVTSYDQLTTTARFDVLWLSDDVRTNYADLYALKFAKTDEQKKTFLRRQLEENNHFISFYVMSLYDQPLGETNNDWNLFLTIDDKNYSPIEIKSVELAPEYMHIFGKKYNRFKVPYSVKFDAKDIDDNFLITPETKKITLHCRTLKVDVTFEWDLPIVLRQAQDEREAKAEVV
jgi:hypothetical protein